MKVIPAVVGALALALSGAGLASPPPNIVSSTLHYGDPCGTGEPIVVGSETVYADGTRSVVHADFDCWFVRLQAKGDYRLLPASKMASFRARA